MPSIYAAVIALNLGLSRPIKPLQPVFWRMCSEHIYEMILYLKHLQLPEQLILHPHLSSSWHDAAIGANDVQCGTQIPLSISQPHLEGDHYSLYFGACAVNIYIWNDTLIVCWTPFWLIISKEIEMLQKKTSISLCVKLSHGELKQWNACVAFSNTFQACHTVFDLFQQMQTRYHNMWMQMATCACTVYVINYLDH
jgi:hypothetical protein